MLGKDGGAPDGDAGDVARAEVTSFKVTSTLSLMPMANQGTWETFPKTQKFTVFIDTKAMRLLAGARGQGTAVELTRTGPGRYSTNELIHIPISGNGCNSAGVNYYDLSFSVEGGRLTGTGRGTATTFMGDAGFIATGTMSLVGLPDDEPPTVIPMADTIDPMGYASFGASEPLVESAASLIGAQGDVFALGAQIREGSPNFTIAFVRSPLMLNWGTTYEVTTEALVDFAGLMGVRSARPTVATPPAPPLVAEDGFESVTATTLGGAAVLGGATLPALAGAKSLMIASWSGGALGTAARQVTLRLPILPGDSVVRFSSRVFAMTSSIPEPSVAEIRVGVPGRDVLDTSFESTATLTEVALGNAGTVYAGPTSTVEVPLPLNAAGEVSFQMSMMTPLCGPLQAQAAVVIDDLRVE